MGDALRGQIDDVFRRVTRDRAVDYVGQQGIGNLHEEYESLDAVAEATEAELFEN